MRPLQYFLTEKAVSKSQRRLFGIALAYKRGELDNVSDEVIELSKLPEKTLIDYAKTPETSLPNQIEEQANLIQVKRKYAGHEPTFVGKFAKVRNNILGFIQEKGVCKKEELLNYIKNTNESNGNMSNSNWFKNNLKYIKEYKDSEGNQMIKLSMLGLRTIKKITLNEYDKQSSQKKQIL